MASLEDLVPVLAALLLAAVPRLFRRSWGPWHLVATAAILYPALEDILAFIEVAPLLGQPTVLQPYTVEQLSRLPWRILEGNLLVPLTGLALVALAGKLAIAGRPLTPVRASPATWARDTHLGLAVAAVAILAQFGALLLLQGPLEILATGDESALFANATVLHVLGLSLAPAIAEELYYRGLLQQVLRDTLPGRHAAAWALGVQGVIFALAHAGFTSISHVVGPLIFGLGMGYLREKVGIGACIVTHASINLAFFSVDPGAGSTALQVATAGLVLIGLSALIAEWRKLWALLLDGLETLEPLRHGTGFRGEAPGKP